MGRFARRLQGNLISMPTLFHAPIACSLAVRIAAAEGQVPLDIEYVDLESKALASGGDLYPYNPLGLVSTLRLDDGQVLTENTAILLWLQAQSPKPGFRRDPNDPDYYQLVQWLAYVSTELHKQLLRIVLYGEATDAVKDRFRALADSRFALLDKHLQQHQNLLGHDVTAADAYLIWFLALTDRAKVSLNGFDALKTYKSRHHQNPVIKTLIDEDFEKLAE